MQYESPSDAFIEFLTNNADDLTTCNIDLPFQFDYNFESNTP